MKSHCPRYFPWLWVCVCVFGGGVGVEVGSGYKKLVHLNLHVGRFMAHNLDIIPYAEFDWSRLCSASPVESNKYKFTLFLFVANPRSLAPLDDALPFS